VELLAGCGHLPMREQPRQLAALLASWLEDLPEATATFRP
jgi:pimeloyl-ACP methyl ester carboxylesterase